MRPGQAHLPNTQRSHGLSKASPRSSSTNLSASRPRDGVGHLGAVPIMAVSRWREEWFGNVRADLLSLSLIHI